MSLSAIYILDVKGKVLISRNYRGDFDLGIIEKFMPLLMEKEEEGLLTPLIYTPECTYSFIKYNNLIIVSTTKKNSNVAMVFVFLHKLVQVSWICTYEELSRFGFEIFKGYDRVFQRT